IVTHPETKAVNSIVLHTPGACELTDAIDERLRYSRPPAVQIKARKLAGKAPSKLRFSASAKDPDRDKILWYSWDFDASDGLQVDATGKRQKHTFTKPGKYVVSLTATDETGVTGVAHARIVIRNP
ncbi:MAG: PKD domain-containing protein, partial [Planctomycetota bacterium]|nr:PKD domain-containing protein [Planctomycetota bacterium]